MSSSLVLSKVHKEEVREKVYAVRRAWEASDRLFYLIVSKWLRLPEADCEAVVSSLGANVNVLGSLVDMPDHMQCTTGTSGIAFPAAVG